MTENFYDKIVVKVKYKGTDGSGVLISDINKDVSYLISAWHCFGDESTIDYAGIEVLRQEIGLIKNISLDFRDTIIIESDDIVIFILDFLEDIPEYQILCPKTNENVTFVGFPNGLNDQNCMFPRYIVRGMINECPESSTIQVNSERAFDTYINDANSNMSGYSGCGIFVEQRENTYLCGIVTELGSPEGLFSFVNGISILEIDDVLFQSTNRHLPDTRWCSFEKFVKRTLDIFDAPLANICAIQIPEIISNVTPKSILEHCGNKIVWPYSDESIHRQEIWEEWLLYLIIRSIENCENIINEDFYIVKNKDRDRKVKVLYATEHTKLPEFLKNYLEYAYHDISTGQIMVVKTDRTPAIKKLSSKKIEDVVSDISSTISLENRMRIDTVEENIRQISIIHIDALVDEMTNFVELEENEDLKGLELEKKLGEKIMEVLYGL